MAIPLLRRVNSWTEWGKLRTIVVGKADFACFESDEPSFEGKKFAKNGSEWPSGKRSQQCIERANRQLDNLASVLTGRGIQVLRPSSIDFSCEVKSPSWRVGNMYNCVCPRDVMLTLGNTVFEATMARRYRFFEYLPYRNIMYQLWDSDASMKWRTAPKPSMDLSMYREGYYEEYYSIPTMTKEKQYEVLNNFQYVLNENEIAFDAADVSRCGRDIFVLHSNTTNYRGIEWLRRELQGIVRVHALDIPNDKLAMHIDVDMVPLRPPRGNRPGVVLTCPDRPLRAKDVQLFRDNNWRVVSGPIPNKINEVMPDFCTCSKWLALNMLSLDEDTVVVEENETEVHALLESMDFNLIKVPFRDVFSFGGSLHCATWDIEREDSNEDFFPNQSS